MSLYAIGDFHLSFYQPKPMEIFDARWKNHVPKLKKYCNRLVKPGDTFVITGDHSWGKDLEECRRDLGFIASLPGNKILLRGNHDRFWDVDQTDRLNELYKGQLSFLQNNYYTYKNYALVGTQGYCYEGKEPYENYLKVMERETGYLQESFEKAIADGHNRFIMFLHYPPTSVGETESEMTRIAKYYKVDQVVYSHCHGERRYHESFHGMVDGIGYSLVSSDYLWFKPKKILK